MGLYPVGTGSPLTQAQATAVRDISSPPFTVRDADKINTDLKFDALPGRPNLVPVFEYNDNNVLDEVSVQGCPFVTNTEGIRYNDPSVWQDYNFMRSQTNKPLEDLYGESDDYINSLDFPGY